MKILWCVYLILLVTTLALGQTPGTSFYKPGDTVRFTVVLDHPTKLEQGAIRIYCLEPSKNEQKGFEQVIWTQQFAASSQNNREYEFFGVIPQNAMSGRYRVDLIQLRADGVTASYQFNTDFKTEVIVEIRNPKPTPLPGISDIRIGPAK